MLKYEIPPELQERLDNAKDWKVIYPIFFDQSVSRTNGN